MQLRHLRYFVKIVDAGSFTRAAATIHVAQPALSQQIAELEDKLGVTLLQRSARGVRPTVAGKALYDEAVSILRQMERLPGIVRSSSGEPVGGVRLGMSSTLSAILASEVIEACRASLPKVSLKLAVSDSESLKTRVDSHLLDMALVFESEMVPALMRTPLFRQRLYVVAKPSLLDGREVLSPRDLGRLPLVLPDRSNVVRHMLDRVFETERISPTILMEADLFTSILPAVRAGIGATVIPLSHAGNARDGDLASAAIDPPMALTASIVASSDDPLTQAGEAVRDLLSSLLRDHLIRTSPPGATWIGVEP